MVDSERKPIGYLRMGFKIKTRSEYQTPDDRKYFKCVIGKFCDFRQFTDRQIQVWVDSIWITNGPIKVVKAGLLFFLFWDRVDDRDNLMAMGFTCFNGALLIFKAWLPGISYDRFEFDEAWMWVRVEGMSIMARKCIVVKQALEKVGKLF